MLVIKSYGKYFDIFLLTRGRRCYKYSLFRTKQRPQLYKKALERFINSNSN